MSTRELMVLSLICEVPPDAATPTTLCERARLDRNAVSKIGDKLVRLGLIRRRGAGDGEADRRLVFYGPTDAGRAVHARLARAIAPSVMAAKAA